MEDSDEDCAEIIASDDPEANVAFWQREFAKFLYAATETEAVSALADALRSDAAMPHIFGLSSQTCWRAAAFALSDPSWTIRAVRRRDAKLTKIRLTAWKHYREVQELNKQWDVDDWCMQRSCPAAQ